MAAQLQYNTGILTAPSLTGSELVEVDTGGAVKVRASTQQISNLSASGTQEVNTALTTVGNGTITGAGLAGRLITRTGPTGVFTDTFPTAAQIVAAIPNAYVGQAFEISIKNGTAFAETLAAPDGTVSLPSTVVIGPNSTGRYLLTLTSLSLVTLTHITTSLVAGLPPAQFSTAALAAGTLAAGFITGAAFVVLTNTGATPGAQTVRTAAQMLADFPQARVGMSYILRIVNTGAGTLTLTADAGPTVTITGTATVAQNVFRDYLVTFNTAITATIQSIGSGVSP